jgi:acyl-CoA synthetase (NDP forming)
LEKLRAVFPPWDISGNPFDLGVTLQFHDPRKVYYTLLEAVAEDPNVDALAIQLPPRLLKVPREFFHPFAQALNAQKPIALWVAGFPSGRDESLQWLEDRYVPVFSSPEKALNALFALQRSSLRKSHVPPAKPGAVLREAGIVNHDSTYEKHIETISNGSQIEDI